MDWAEDLKLSIRKTALKGRRSSSQQKTSSTPTPNSPDKELALNINVDIGNSSTEDDQRRPPRRILGGWADSATKLGRSKSKSNLIEDERFRLSTATSKSRDSPPSDDIPIIPDLDDVKDEMLLNEIVEPPSVTVNRVVTLKELNSDLLSQNAFSAMQDVDLSILTKCLESQSTLDEPDEVWEWEKLFTEVIAEINADKPMETKIEIAADEVVPTHS